MINMSPKQREVFLESARLAGEWYVNTQNTEENPWGGVHESADFGRYIYEYFVARKWCRGMGVWGQALAIMALLTLERRVAFSEGRYRKSALAAAEYLKSLQIVNPSDPKNHGGFREHTPQVDWSFPRDGATGGMGFCALYKETGQEEYLERAKMFAQWYHDYGSDESGWPHCQYSFSKRAAEPTEYGRGDWQAGGALAYYWLYKLTGDKRWLDYFRQMVDPLTEMLERNTAEPEILDFHGKTEVTYGNNDFSTNVMISAYRQWHDKRMLKAIVDYLHRLWKVEASDGTYPTFGGTFVATIGHLDYLQLCREENLPEDTKALEERILRSANATLLQQETQLKGDVRACGGFYGQSGFGVSRERIHHRSTGYAMIMNLRMVGGTATPYYSSWGWDK